ncbi:hypothetical protein K491DRAFT_698031 [Lophiostoma macrostomum CBS 122681]|uniref:Uncharacterized protein n=1 Tax=Lophiostoma macrostomum CBS 122681 TaxID=1314788 RepID=A0A6A6SP78_9PLEO|nr:hypothetical protein K491DRAFT_698031 [Lophiostoma macrostomum CBS 122681]
MLGNMRLGGAATPFRVIEEIMVYLFHMLIPSLHFVCFPWRYITQSIGGRTSLPLDNEHRKPRPSHKK